MKVVSVNVGRPRTVEWEGRKVRSAIWKSPVEGRVPVRGENVEGDTQSDLRVHGGPDKAVYLYPAEHYETWQRELGRTLDIGHFGENLTITGLVEEEVHIGDVLMIGEAVLEVTQPRQPCFKLGIKMNDQRFLRRFLESGRSGFYCRVLTEGRVETGDGIGLSPAQEHGPTIAGIVRMLQRRG